MWTLPSALLLSLAAGTAQAAATSRKLDALNANLTITVNGAPQSLTDFELYAGSQDRNKQYGVPVVDGAKITLRGNQWKAMPIEDYTVTPKTVLEFDFFIDEIAEEQAICLDEDLANNEKRCFLVGGEDNPSDMYKDEKTTVEQGEGHYKIPVGLFYENLAGPMKYLAVVQDYDAARYNGTSAYANIHIYEEERSNLKVEINGALADLDAQVTYESISQDKGNNYVEVSPDGLSATMHGNMWKAFPLPATYQTTGATVLEFDFSNAEDAEFTSICRSCPRARIP